jgi:2'-5' RNA ligase
MRPAARGVRRLRDVASAATGTARTAVVVLVPSAEALVAPWRERYDEAAAAGMPAHITVLYPFLPARKVDGAVEAALGETVGQTEAFRFRLTHLDTFPAVAYLAPEPAAPFVELTTALWRRWPECPPYGGAHDEVVPHLTVATGSPPAGIEELEAGLPLEGTADEVWLMAKDRRGRWSRLQRFALASG